MSLTSIYYLLFLATIVATYYKIKHEWRIYLLLAGSFIFYYLNQKWYVAFLFSSIIVNYLLCASWLKFRNKLLIYGAVLYNVLLLVFFKYIPVILYGNEIPKDSIWTRLVLPIGISFFSFQAIGYVLDLYWENRKQQSPLAKFALYMSFFPQLLAGPIARSKNFIPQIEKYRVFSYESVVSGGRLILWGLFKKIVVANNLSPYTDAVFNNLQMHSGLTLVLATFAYTIQVYMDFSGYSDIAIGSAKALGYNLMENFRIPFFAKSVTDFWRRWHISLSSWIRDYVNTPLQFRLRGLGVYGVFIAAYMTFFIIGIWHGANWSFVVFGFIQGCAVTYEVLTQEVRKKVSLLIPSFIRNIASNVVVFVFMSFCIILLRASLSDAWMMLSRMSLKLNGVYWGSKQLLIYASVGIIIVWLVEFVKGDELFTEFVKRWSMGARWFFYVFCTITILLIGSLSSENFIYFQY